MNIGTVQGRILCFDVKGGVHNDEHVDISFNYQSLTYGVQTRLMYSFYYTRSNIHSGMPKFSCTRSFVVQSHRTKTHTTNNKTKTLFITLQQLAKTICSVFRSQLWQFLPTEILKFWILRVQITSRHCALGLKKSNIKLCCLVSDDTGVIPALKWFL